MATTMRLGHGRPERKRWVWGITQRRRPRGARCGARQGCGDVYTNALLERAWVWRGAVCVQHGAADPTSPRAGKVNLRQLPAGGGGGGEIDPRVRAASP